VNKMGTGTLWINGNTMLVYDSSINGWRAITQRNESYREIQIAPDWAKSWFQEQERLKIKENTKTYDYSPFAIVKTDHKTFMSIEALEHKENRYNAGYKKYSYCEIRWQEWKKTFQYLQPFKIGSIQIWKNPHAPPLQVSLSKGKWNIKR
jgi:hypothetical protein